MDSALLQMLITAVATFLAASGGFWVYLRQRSKAKDSTYRLLLGLAHYKIVDLGMRYIENGFVTKDEYDDLVRYFWDPYLELGGNGSAERIMLLVKRLPLTLSKSSMASLADDVRVRATDKAARMERDRSIEYRDREDDDIDHRGPIGPGNQR